MSFWGESFSNRSQVSWKIGSATLALALASWLNMASTTLAQTTLEEVIQQKFPYKYLDKINCAIIFLLCQA